MPKSANFKVWVLPTRSDGKCYSAPPIAAPTNVAAAITGSSATLTWSASASTLGTISGYDVYVNSIKHNSSLVTALTYTITGLTAGVQHGAEIIAVDSAGNVSARSSAASFMVPVVSAGQILLSASSYSVAEGASLTFTASRSGGSAGAIAVDWAFSAFAEGTPLTPLGTINWANNESGAKNVAVTAGLVSANRTGTLTLSNARSTSGGATPTITAATATINVSNDAVAPGAVTLTATVASSSQINLQVTGGTDADSGFANYIIERSLNGSSGWSVVATQTAADFWNTGLTASTQYFYRARAVDRAGNYSSGYASANGTTQAASSTFDYYISPTGSGSAAAGGTIGDPWAITMLNNSTARARYAGNSVGLMNGTYATGGISPFDGGSSPSLNPAPGTSGNPTVIQAVNPRMAILDHAGGGVGCMGALNSTCAHFQIRGLKFINTRDFSIYINRNGGGDGGRAAGIGIYDCEFSDQAKSDMADLTDAIFLQATDDAIVSNCYFSGIVNTVQASSVSAILQYGTRRTVVEYSTFDSVYAGVHSKYAGGTPRTDDQGTIVRCNYFKNIVIACRGFDNKDQTTPPPTAAPYEQYLIENNVFEDCANELSNDGSFCSASPMVVRNNTIYAVSAGAKRGFNLHSLASNAHPSYYNNIWYIGGSASWTEIRALTVCTSGGSGLYDVLDYNCYSTGMEWATMAGYGYPYAGAYDTITTKAAWQAATDGDIDGRSLFATNPSFAMTGSNADRFQLGGGSPCLNAGRVGGASGGALRHMGAWDGVVTQIGPSWAP